MVNILNNFNNNSLWQAIEKTLIQGRKEVQKLGLQKKSTNVSKATVSSLAKQNKNVLPVKNKVIVVL